MNVPISVLPPLLIRIGNVVCIGMNRIVGSDLSCMSTVMLCLTRSSDLTVQQPCGKVFWIIILLLIVVIDVS